jgi:xylulokinase
MPEALIGLDLGTTACKGILVDRGLNILSRAESLSPLITLDAERIEQDAGRWWEVTRELIGRLAAQASAGSIRGIGLAAQGISFVPVDRRGEPLRNALSWLDTRAGPQTERVLSQLGERQAFALTGKRVSAVYVLPKLLWLRDAEPEVFRRTAKILMALDFLTARLCGEALTDHTMASGTLLYDLSLQQWSDSILQRFELDRDLLPEIRWSGSCAGTVKRELAIELGLPSQTAVAIGGQDQKVAALAAGLDLEKTTISLGTAMAVARKDTRPVIDSAMRLPCFSDLLPRRWVLEGSGIGTSCLDWARANLLGGRSFDQLEGMARKLDGIENRLYFYPYLAGTDTLHFGENLRGCLYGLDFSVSAEKLLKSVFEGVAYKIREHLDLLESATRPVGELRLFGGGARSGAWVQTIADVCGRPVATFATSEMGSLGAAMLAGVGAGVFAGAEEAASLTRIDRRIEPRTSLAAMYERQYREYLEIQRRLSAGARS